MLRKGPGKKSEEGVWAVSYADFLMVLLTFFILFFSIDSKGPLAKVALSFQNGGKGAEADSASTPAATGLSQGRKPASVHLEALSKLFKTSAFKTENDRNGSLILTLPDDTYGVGKYEAPAALLDRIAETLRPYDGKVAVQVIGHADPIGFPDGNSRVIGNNLTLSSFRAVLASEYLQKGLPNTFISMRASQKSARKSRSLTLFIRESDVGDEL